MPMIPEDDLELQNAATQLASLLGLNQASLDKLLAGELIQKQKVEIKEKKHCIKDKEYILRKVTRCSCCSTESSKLYTMRQLGFSDTLYSTETELIPADNTLPIREEYSVSKTCNSCASNLELLSKSDLIQMYLELLNKPVESISLNTCLVEEIKFQALQEAKKRRIVE